MSNVIAAFNLLQVLTLPTLQEVNNDIATVTQSRQKLDDKFFGASSQYDHTKPSDFPVNISTLFLIEHIENVDEDFGAVNLHGAVLLGWNDSRLTWDPRDYNNITVFDLSERIGNIYAPNLIFRNIRKTKVFNYFNTEISVTYDGRITTSSSVSVVTECYMDYTNYPLDNVTCAVALVSLGTSGMRLRFDPTPQTYKLEDMFNKDWRTTTGGQFRLTDQASYTYWFYPGGITKNISEIAMLPYRLSNSLVRYEFKLQRNSGHYVSLIGLPLFASALCAFIVVVMDPSVISLIYLIVCFLMQAINTSRILSSVPRNALVMPRCVKMMAIVTIETFFLMVYRFVMLLFFKSTMKAGNAMDNSKLRQCESLLAAVVAISGAIHLWILLL
uniref:Neur_chan_LBD domain-containing protein n=1 Tax=Panagrellus redivivus TaxID=6233 RepID=A0A7E4W8S0_PANRE